MRSVNVIGGVYGERCAFPPSEDVYGSGGRAAAGLADHVDIVRLHTMLPRDEKERFNVRLHALGVDVVAKESKKLIGFDYLHCLASPVITPPTLDIQRQDPLHVEAKVAVLFGMIECTATVKADVCVYDPQSPTKPVGFRASGSQANRLAIVANAHEIALLTGKSGVEAARELLAREQAEVVVVKNGIHGAIAVDGYQKEYKVPAYVTTMRFKIGSGDIFTAAFALAWAIEKKPPAIAADYASRAAANYMDTDVVPMRPAHDATIKNRNPVEINQKHVYLAGPFRNIGQRAIINEARSILRNFGMKVFSPVHDIGHGPACRVVKQDLDALQNADVVVAILNGNSPGTVFEVGYAAALKKPIFCIAQNVPENDLKLPRGANCEIYDDLVSGLHALAVQT